ncbi:MAG: hypothetical protein JSV86_16425 [Gemmatimonadota bacterium]|nr:MAG: hypothetical protein JSV86_16425 [Gemmatimonadota bacterium]
MNVAKSVLSNGVVFLLIGLVSASPLAAQEEEEEAPQPGTIVFSQNKCPYENLPTLNTVLDSIATPVLDELLAEGQLLGWGVLTHSWGDEWNWNIYYVVESHRAFLDFWSEYIRRLNESYPGWYQQFVGLCTDHKDNIYSVRVSR